MEEQKMPPVSVSAIIEELSTVAAGYKAGGVIHKAKAYNQAIDSIRSRFGATGVISEAQLPELKSLPSVGKGMVEKVAEMLRTGGVLAQATQVANDPTIQALELMTSIYGVGPVKANELVREYKITTIDGLRARPDLITPKIELGLRFYEDSMLKIPFDECEVIAQAISRVAKSIDPRLRAICVGSHRREKPLSGDIDILVTHPLTHSSVEYVYLPRLLQLLQAGAAQECEVLTETLASGTTKFNGYCKLRNVPSAKVRRIDLRWVAADGFFFMLLHFTGSAQSNVRMRQVAIEHGLRLNEWGLWKPIAADAAAAGGTRRGREGGEGENNTDSASSAAASASAGGKSNKASAPAGAPPGMELAVLPSCEADIFAALGLDYKAPKAREFYTSHDQQQ